MYKSNHSFTLQGPALYAYNNAMFTPEDWKGIRMLCDSIKETDLMKVGRFGLGFKSVFHMTGTSPQLVAQDKLGSDMIFKWYEIMCSYPRDPNKLLSPVSVTLKNMNSLRVCGEIPCIVTSKLISVVNTSLSCGCLFVQFDFLLYDKSCFDYV